MLKKHCQDVSLFVTAVIAHMFVDGILIFFQTILSQSRTLITWYIIPLDIIEGVYMCLNVTVVFFFREEANFAKGNLVGKAQMIHLQIPFKMHFSQNLYSPSV